MKLQPPSVRIRCDFRDRVADGRCQCQDCGYLAPLAPVACAKVYRICPAHHLRPAPGSRGLGDTLAWLIHLFSFGLIEPCDACNSRRAWLNRKFPYRR